MVSGEYAVLAGARALVLAVDARALATLADVSSVDADRSPGPIGRSPRPAPPAPEVVLAQREAERALGVEPMSLEVDTSALRDGYAWSVFSHTSGRCRTLALK